MLRDTRKFKVEVAGDDALLWRVLAVLETTAYSAVGAEPNMSVRLEVGHETGKYIRSSVSEAKATAERNGFEVESIDLKFYEPMFGSSGQELDIGLGEIWIWAIRYLRTHPLTVDVLSGSEVEVNGRFAMLQEAVKAEIGSRQEGLNNAVLLPGADESPVSAPSAPPPPLWRRVVNHGWTVEVVGGLIAAVVGGLVLVWLSR